MNGDAGEDIAQPSFGIDIVEFGGFDERVEPELDYPFHDKAVTVTTCGRICLHRKKINISIVLAGQTLGIKEVADRIWLASFMQYDLGYFDLKQRPCNPPTTQSA